MSLAADAAAAGAGGEAAPAHHARRPMNAFLIFCKRHRAVVRDKYPNLENRSITKILGEWWANLDREDKASYTALAKQYKDAFFNANPDFKWYKLPAPPLRATVPRADPAAPAVPAAAAPPEPEATNNNCSKLDLNKGLEPSAFTPGKLASEADMGGLSSLLATNPEDKVPNPYHSPTMPFEAARSNIAYENEIQSDDQSIRELQHALSETTRMFEDLGEGGAEQMTNQDVIDRVVERRLSREDDCAHRQGSDDDRDCKTKRSCKGKKYQEFMAVGGFIVHKRHKKDHADKLPEYQAPCAQEEVAAPADAADNDTNINKTFQASDFDLDAKIKALPSLSLEKFQQKKRDNKRKKKNNYMKPKFEEQRYLSFGRDVVAIGSQKRKPRKISITRLEISSLISAVELGAGRAAPPPPAPAPPAPPALPALPAPPAHGSADLLALATLAEVASNTCKLGGAAIL